MHIPLNAFPEYWYRMFPKIEGGSWVYFLEDLCENLSVRRWEKMEMKNKNKYKNNTTNS